MSTECYRDFWPTEAMAALVGRSIDLVEDLAKATDNAVGFTRRGYAYFTKSPETLARAAADCARLAAADPANMPLRRHAGFLGDDYAPIDPGFSDCGRLEELPRGFDLLEGAAVRAAFPAVADDVVGCVHARRAGWVSAQQFGAELVNAARALGAEFATGADVVGVDVVAGAVDGVWVERDGRRERWGADAFVNASGPNLNAVHGLLPGADRLAPGVAAACGLEAGEGGRRPALKLGRRGGAATPRTRLDPRRRRGPGDASRSAAAPRPRGRRLDPRRRRDPADGVAATPLAGRRLPVVNHLHAKVIFRDVRRAVPRDAPMMISLDPCVIWDNAGDYDSLAETFGASRAKKLCDVAGPGVHLRPYGHDALLLLWEHWHADHVAAEPPDLDPTFDAELFPEVCLRGLARTVPALREYVDGDAGSKPHVDGGYYTCTPENYPLVGPVCDVTGAYVCGGLAGYGLMAAHGAGELLAAHVVGGPLPAYAGAFDPRRYGEEAYLPELLDVLEKGGGAI